jgi:hypothetical protein
MASQAQQSPAIQPPAQAAIQAPAVAAKGAGNAAAQARMPGARLNKKAIPGKITDADVNHGKVLSALTGHWSALAFNTGAGPAIRAQEEGTGPPSGLGLVETCPDALLTEFAGMLGSIAGDYRGGETSYHDAGAMYSGTKARIHFGIQGRNMTEGTPVPMAMSALDTGALANTVTDTAGITASATKEGIGVGMNQSLAMASARTTTGASGMLAQTSGYEILGELVFTIRIDVQGQALDAAVCETQVEGGRFCAHSKWQPE